MANTTLHSIGRNRAGELLILVSDPTITQSPIWCKTNEETVLSDGTFVNTSGKYITEEELRDAIKYVKQSTNFSVEEVYSYAN